MKKHIKKLTIVFLMMFLLTGCGVSGEINGMAVNFVDINDTLVYDSLTHVIYIENYTYYGNMVYTTYYNADGKVVLYDGQDIKCEMKSINDLYAYDIYTNIVYIDNYTYYGNVVYTSYFNEKGQICRFDTESQTIVPISSTEDTIE